MSVLVMIAIFRGYPVHLIRVPLILLGVTSKGIATVNGILEQEGVAWRWQKAGVVPARARAYFRWNFPPPRLF
jgi:hypothetical protein